MLFSASTTQKIIALSSAEAEYYALVHGACRALGFQSIAADLGWTFDVRVHVDASAGKAIAGRRGLGSVRHLDVKCLWVQDLVADGRLTLAKICGTRNPADILTKPKSVREVQDLVSNFGVVLHGS